MINKKWQIIKTLFLCKCGLCFKKRDDLMEHLKDTKRYRKYHYAPDYQEIPFRIFLTKKKS